jgi:hypothetical protein
MSVSPPLIGLVQLARDQVICKALGKLGSKICPELTFGAFLPPPQVSKVNKGE